MISYDCRVCGVEKMVQLVLMVDGIITGTKDCAASVCVQMGHTEPIAKCWCPACGVLYNPHSVRQ